MKNNLPTIVWLPLAFIAGGLVGYYGPAEELRNSERRIEEVKAETKSKSPKRNDELAFGTFTQMMKIPDAANKHKRRPTANPIAKNEVGSANTNPPVANDETPSQNRPSAEDLRARIDQAADLWRTRIDVKRATTIANLGLDDKGVASFDEAIAGMNAKLKESIQIIADEIAENSEMTNELGIRLMGELAISLAETYDALGTTVDAEKRGDISRLQLVEFVDPSVAEPLIAVQDKLSNLR